MALSQAKQTATEARMAALETPKGSGWANSARRDALARLREMGMPARRDEYWRFTDPTDLSGVTPIAAAVFDNDEREPFADVDCLKIVFNDGVFDPAGSDALEMSGIEIDLLADATSKDIHWANDLFGVLETRGQDPVSRPLATLNTATAENGVVIRVTGSAPKPVSLIYTRSTPTCDAVVHHIIRLEEGARFTMLESGPGAARFNTVLEVDVSDSAAFNHVRMQGRDHERRAATHLFARLGAESVFKSFTMTANGALTRNEAILELTGDNAVAHVAGATVGDGEFHHDDTVFVTHDAVACESRQVFKKVLRNGATGVFQGKILVKKGAQKTDGYQISQSLLLDGDSQFLAKPELEIYADDVICSHGSTSGAIDEDAMFYFRSRGIGEQDAQDLLVLAFLAEAIDEIEDPAIAEDVLERLQSWLQRHR